MPIFFQQDIDAETKLAIWKIEEEEDFFLQHVPLQREITHPHKRLQHLAGRYLLQYLFPDFPISLIKIADTRKPFLEDEAYHFSISHCGSYAAAIVSKTKRVGLDIEVPTHKVEKIKHKFLSEVENALLNSEWAIVKSESAMVNMELESTHAVPGRPGTTEEDIKREDKFVLLTLLWSCKEAMFKWWGLGDVDFRTMLRIMPATTKGFTLTGTFTKDDNCFSFPLSWKQFPELVLAWVVTTPAGQTIAAANATPSQ